MKTVEDTFVRGKNVRFFLILEDSKTVRSAAVKVGLSLAQATRLVRFWKSKGMVKRVGSLHGCKYELTDLGLSVFGTLALMDADLGGEEIWKK